MKMDKIPGREKIIKGLECCIGGFPGEKNCKQCQYRPHIDGCKSGAIMDALALLKAQEPMEPRFDTWWFVCGNCEQSIEEDYNYCPNCGRQVKWE